MVSKTDPNKTPTITLEEYQRRIDIMLVALGLEEFTLDPHTRPTVHMPAAELAQFVEACALGGK